MTAPDLTLNSLLTLTRRPFLLLAVTLACGSMSLTALANTLHSVGIARDSEERIRYIEHHQYLGSGDHVVSYYDPEMNLLLRKELSYPGLPQQPSLRQTDPVNEVEITVSSDQGRATMIRQTPEGEETFAFELSEQVIIDAGFDTFIRSGWDTFDTRPEQRLKLAVAGQFRLIDMEISYLGETNGLREFTITPRNWLVRLIIPETRLTYRADRQLLKYQGLSNLQLDPRPGVVEISFEHLQGDLFFPGSLVELIATKTSMDS